MNLIVAFTSNLGIGKDNNVPWYISEDLKRFSTLTQNSAVIMGRKTWQSLPQKPLKNRLNIIITSEPDKYTSDKDTVFIDYKNIDDYLLNIEMPIYIIGGSDIYNYFINRVDVIYATMIEKEYDCDTFFKVNNFDKFEIDKYSEKKYSEHEKCHYRYINYIKSDKPHEEHKYLHLMNDILYSGKTERPDRTGVGTLSNFGVSQTYDISGSVPFLTTKKLAWKTVLKELLFFLRGETDSKILEKQGVNIWKGNTSREFLDKRGLTQYPEGSMGPMYGYNLLHWNYPYQGPDHDYTDKGYNQITELLKNLKEDPYSRRHLLTTYNPEIVKDSVLCPCHGISIQFYVEDDNMLSCHVYNRSQDSFLGMPFNIASYAILTYIIAKKVNMKPHKLIMTSGDTHIYTNHFDQVNTQLTRIPFPFPVLELSETIKDKDMKDINIDDFELIGYLHHPPIKAPMAI